MSDFTESKKRWNEGYRVVITCSKCKDEVHSSYSGEFVQCKCGECAVDQTLWYTRLIGTCGKSELRHFPKYKKSNDSQA